jgi:hypothetical protein
MRGGYHCATAVIEVVVIHRFLSQMLELTKVAGPSLMKSKRIYTKGKDLETCSMRDIVIRLPCSRSLLFLEDFYDHLGFSFP